MEREDWKLYLNVYLAPDNERKRYPAGQNILAREQPSTSAAYPLKRDPPFTAKRYVYRHCAMTPAASGKTQKSRVRGQEGRKRSGILVTLLGGSAVIHNFRPHTPWHGVRRTRVAIRELAEGGKGSPQRKRRQREEGKGTRNWLAPSSPAKWCIPEGSHPASSLPKLGPSPAGAKRQGARASKPLLWTFIPAGVSFYSALRPGSTGSAG